MWRLVFVLCLLGASAWAAPPTLIVGAEYVEPTTRYDHGILGDAVEWGALKLTVDLCRGCETGPQLRKFLVRLPENRVFEDIKPRIVSVLNQGGTEVMVVETDLAKGARLALYDQSGLIAATPFIGRPHRWLAPIGAADLDGDGRVEIAYVDRPHLAKTIRLWHYEAGSAALVPVANLPGFTNHRIGWDFIPGGIRDCGDGPEMIVADADWQNTYAIRFGAAGFSTRNLGQYTSPNSLRAAQICP